MINQFIELFRYSSDCHKAGKEFPSKNRELHDAVTTALHNGAQVEMISCATFLS